MFDAALFCVIVCFIIAARRNSISIVTFFVTDPFKIFPSQSLPGGLFNRKIKSMSESSSRLILHPSSWELYQNFGSAVMISDEAAWVRRLSNGLVSGVSVKELGSRHSFM